jgi:cobalt/nickel transport system permease protein
VEHVSLEQYVGGASLAHRLHPCTKLVFALLYVLVVVLSPPGSWAALGVYFGIISAVIIASRVPLGRILRRSLVVLPLVLMVGVFLPFFREGEIAYTWNAGPIHTDLTSEGILAFETVLAKAWISMLALVWLTSVTRVKDLIQAMRRIRVPAVLVMIISLMYRYLFVILDEALTMKQARDSRSPRGTRAAELRSLGGIIGTLFIRSYERSERVYSAMAARGFDGEHRAAAGMALTRSDIAIGATSAALLVLVAVYNLVAGG